MKGAELSLGRRIFRDTMIVSAISVIVQAISFGYGIYVAAIFGATWQTDAFYLAFTIPLFAANVVQQAIKAVFVPVFVQFKVKEHEATLDIVGSSIFAVSIISLGAAMVIALTVPVIVPSLAGGFSEDGLLLTVRLTWELLPVLPLMCLAGVLSAVFNAYQRFALPALVPGVDALIKVLSVLALTPLWGIHSLAAGAVLGSMGSVVLLIAGAVWAELPLTISCRLHPGLLRMGRLALFPIIGHIFLQLNPIVNRSMAALLPTGSITALNYAERIIAIPYLVMGSGFFSVLLSHWSQLVAEKGIEELRRALRNSVTMVAYVFTPIVVLMLLLRGPLVQLLLQRGQFDQEDAILTALALGFLALGIVPQYIGMLLSRVFLVLQDTRTPTFIGIANSVLNLLLNLLLIGLLGLGGIALSTSLTITILTLAKWILVRQRVGAWTDPALVRSIACITVSGLACALGGYAGYSLAGLLWHTSSLWQTGGTIALVGGLGLVLFLGVSLALRVEELGKIRFLLLSLAGLSHPL